MGQKIELGPDMPEAQTVIAYMTVVGQQYADKQGERVGVLVELDRMVLMLVAEADFDKLPTGAELVRIIDPVNPALRPDSHDGRREGNTREEPKGL